MLFTSHNLGRQQFDKPNFSISQSHATPMLSLQYLVTLLSLLGVLIASDAFQVVPPIAAARMKPKTELSAWTIMPTTAAPFSTWYNEYNPTARRTVYEDSPLDYNFVTLGDDWPSVEAETTTVANEEARQIPKRRGPIRRMAEWAGRVRRRS